MSDSCDRGKEGEKVEDALRIFSSDRPAENAPVIHFRF
jgi:hypothetical protein